MRSVMLTCGFRPEPLHSIRRERAARTVRCRAVQRAGETGTNVVTVARPVTQRRTWFDRTWFD